MQPPYWITTTYLWARSTKVSDESCRAFVYKTCLQTNRWSAAER